MLSDAAPTTPEEDEVSGKLMMARLIASCRCGTQTGLASFRRAQTASKAARIVALSFLITPLFITTELFAQNTQLLILEKARSILGFYTMDGKRVAGVPVGTHPHEMILSPDGRFLYTTDNGKMRMEDPGEGGNTISIVDLPARRKVGEINLGEFRRPHGIDLDPERGRLVVTAENPDQLLIIDIESRSITRHYDTQGKTSHMVTLGPRAEWAYVSNSSSGNVSAIHVDSGEVKLITTGERTQGGVVSKDGKEFYVVSKDSDRITVIDTANQERKGVIETGQGPGRIAITVDGKYLVYSLGNAHAIGIADPRRRKQIAQISISGEPVSLSLSPDGKLAFSSAQFVDRVFVVSLPERMIIRTIKTPAGSGPDAVMQLPAGK